MERVQIVNSKRLAKNAILPEGGTVQYLINHDRPLLYAYPTRLNDIALFLFVQDNADIDIEDPHNPHLECWLMVLCDKEKYQQYKQKKITLRNLILLQEKVYILGFDYSPWCIGGFVFNDATVYQVSPKDITEHGLPKQDSSL